jgi:glycopeptide antibiotics resistance protein
MQRVNGSGRLAFVALGLYGMVLAAIGLFPTPVDTRASPVIRSFLVRVHELGIPAWFDYGLIEFTANIFLFVPLGGLLVLALGRRRAWLAVLIGIVVSLTIEVAQALVLPERHPSAMDVLANSLGAVLGATVAIALLTPAPRVARPVSG